jgi:phage tail tape-measure protein
MVEMDSTKAAAPKTGKRTPAPKEDQKKGSKKNKPDSAKDEKGKIEFSAETEKRLAAKVKEHNAKVEKSGKGHKASLGALKAVYRRGAGAYSTSHAPGMSRDGWAMARVAAFLHLLRTGSPKNSKYTQDNDLLPKGHPKSSK